MRNVYTSSLGIMCEFHKYTGNFIKIKNTMQQRDLVSAVNGDRLKHPVLSSSYLL